MRPLRRLFRPRLALLNGVSATAGYLLHPAEVRAIHLTLLFCGVTLLAAGGSALNQVLERDLDAMMARTRQRPLPQGELTPVAATAVGACVILCGVALLAVTGGMLPPLLGAAALAWYLLVYTPLKRRTPFALALGALCGALPPLIGWSLAGGDPMDYRPVLLAGLLYIWQVPHFWLLQHRHADDYRRAGIPLAGAASRGGDRAGLSRLWIIALIAGSALLPAFGIIERHVAFWYIAFPVPLIVMTLFRFESALFPYLNLFPLMVTIILLVQK
ncbi:MAG TPA: protoheme IX farnesyltransferase [Desulfuromonadaceae bacterium]